MNTIELKLNEKNLYLYAVNEVNAKCVGVWVLASEAAERERVLREALEFYVEDDECKYGPSEGGKHPYCEDDDACRWCKAQQALEASDESD